MLIKQTKKGIEKFTIFFWSKDYEVQATIIDIYFKNSKHSELLCLTLPEHMEQTAWGFQD